MTTEELQWEPTEEEIKDIFKNEGFHVSPYNMLGPVSLYNRDRRSCYSHEEMNSDVFKENTNHTAIEAIVFYLDKRNDFIETAKNLKNSYDIFVFYLVKRVSDLIVPEVSVWDKAHNDKVKDDRRIMVRGALLKE